MAANKFLRKQVKVLFFFLAILFSLLAKTPSASAQEPDFEPWVYIPRQLVDVDGDGQEESFEVLISLTKDGSLFGSGIINDGEATTLYQVPSGDIACDNTGRSYLLLNSKILSQVGGRKKDGVINLIMTLSTDPDSGTLVLDNNGNGLSDGFEVQGQMNLFVDPCPTSWRDWLYKLEPVSLSQSIYIDSESD